MNSDDLVKQEKLCRLLVKAALLSGELAALEAEEEMDSDLQVAINCAVSKAHNLEIHIINSITSV